jgi:DNA-binding response OmpR family regulator
MKIVPSQMRILIADDQPDVLEALRLLLKRDGYKIPPASTANDRKSRLRRRDHRSELHS